MCRKIQCDRKSEKFYKISQKLNKAQIRLTQAQQASCFLSWLCKATTHRLPNFFRISVR